ncbi:MAG TPA: hypothetical protein VF188_06800 [Longimicrobiales bacterium]
MRRTAIGWILTANVVLAGCGAGAADAPLARAAVDTVAGIERWLYPGAGGPALEWSIDTVAVIGGAMATDDAYQFDQIDRNGLAVDAAGRLYVLDRAGVRVLVYDSLGRHGATYGREGGGPGELGMPLSLAVADDSIWVADFGNHRYTIYPRDGGEAREVTLAEELGIPTGRLVVADGSIVQVLRPFGLRRMLRGGAGGPPPEPPRPILRLSTAGEVMDTLWISEPPEMVEAQAGTPSSGRLVMVRTPRQFEPRLEWEAFSDGGIVVADTTAYVLNLIAADGTPVRRVARDLPPRETTEADKEFARERLREMQRRGGGIRIAIRQGGGGGSASAAPPAEEFIKAQLEAMTFAPVIPRITGLRVDALDRIWVGVSLDEPETTERIDVFDREGRLIGELTGWELPDAFLGPSLAARIVRDEDDVQQILIYRIQ